MHISAMLEIRLDCAKELATLGATPITEIAIYRMPVIIKYHI